MCGIAGILGARRAARETTLAMARALRHRGPDDEGVWLSNTGIAAFAHTRLSIIDLSSGGRQPMSTPDGRLTITYNGEIYNYKELRTQLADAGVVFNTHSDTEVILRAYQLLGIDFLSRLRGMFAIAIWDEREHKCLFARDRFGVKPLYYSDRSGVLVFASEVRTLLSATDVARTLDTEGVYGYFRTGSVPEPYTLVREIRCFEAGSWAYWADGRLEAPKHYWQIAFTPTIRSLDNAVAATRAALVDSVEHHFVSDVPVGIFLSAGIDSTALLALAAASGNRELHTFSISFPGTAIDEGPVARETAKRFGTRHEEWACNADEGKSLFWRFLDALDQPSIDGFNTYAISRFASERGLKVVLSGLGGDELFGGYPSFRAVPRMAVWHRRLKRAGPLRTLAAMTLRHATNPKWRRLGEFVEGPGSAEEAYATFRGIFTQREARALTSRYVGPIEISAATSSSGEDPNRANSVEDLDLVGTLELSRYMRNQLLRDSDVASMAWGLELRVPFLDSALVDTLLTIPAEIRNLPGKRLLLDAVPEIPSSVAIRQKTGFGFPFERWLSDEWHEVFALVGSSSPVPTETWFRKWCVFVMEKWLQRHGMAEIQR